MVYFMKFKVQRGITQTDDPGNMHIYISSRGEGDLLKQPKLMVCTMNYFGLISLKSIHMTRYSP